MLPSIAKSFFENLSENIRNIRVRLDIDRTMAINSGTDTGTAPCRPHLLLRSFALEDSLSGVEEYLLLRFLQSCGKNLQHIFTPKEEHFAVHSLFQTLAGFSVQEPGIPVFVEGLHIVGSHVIARMVSQSHVWKTVNLEFQRHFEDRAVEAL
ncbi:hypothetical protein BG000_004127 [Podila horticola]|nr:hypothetical protein BG000_004127 [Podila horticola]